MKKIYFILIGLIITLLSISNCYAFSLNGSGSVYAGSARNYARYYQQNPYANRYSRQPKQYIFSAQQARYYGYRVPQQQQTTNAYNPYLRGY